MMPCVLDSSMPQVPGAGLLHLHSLLTVIEISQQGQAQVDPSTHSEDVSPDGLSLPQMSTHPTDRTPNYSRTLLGPLAI